MMIFNLRPKLKERFIEFKADFLRVLFPDQLLCVVEVIMV